MDPAQIGGPVGPGIARHVQIRVQNGRISVAGDGQGGEVGVFAQVAQAFGVEITYRFFIGCYKVRIREASVGGRNAGVLFKPQNAGVRFGNSLNVDGEPAGLYNVFPGRIFSTSRYVR